MPSVNQVIDSYLIQTAITDGVSQPAERMAESLDQISAAAQAAGERLLASSKASQDAGAQITQTSQAWSAISKRNDDVTAATFRLTQALAALTRAQGLATAQMAAGTGDVEQIDRVITNMTNNVLSAADALAELESQYVAVTEAEQLVASTMTDTIQEMVEQTAATRAASEAQAQYNQLLNVQAPTSQASFSARAQDIAAYGAALDATRAKFDPLFAASKAYEAQFVSLQDAIRTGAVSGEAQEAAALDNINKQFQASIAPTTKAQQSLDSYTNSAKANAVAFRLLGVQAVQGFSGIATGQDVLTVLIQQGHQVVDVALATGTGFTGMASAAKAAFTAMGGFSTLGIAAVVAAIGFAVIETAKNTSALATSTRELGNTMQVMGTSASVSAPQVAALEVAIERLGVSTKDADAIGKSISETGGGAGGLFSVQFWADLAAATNAAGGNVAAISKEVIQASQGNGGAIDDLVKAFNLLNGAQLTNIHNMLANGEQAAAFQVVFEALNARIKDEASKSLGFFGSIANSIENLFGRASDAMKQTAQDAHAFTGGMEENAGILAGGGLPGAETVTDAEKQQAQIAAGGLLGPPLPPPQTASQADTISKENQALDENTRILQANITERARLKAQIDATNEGIKQGLVGDDLANFVSQRLTGQIQKETTAFTDNLQAMSATDQVGVSMANAVDQGSAAMLRAQAAAEAHAEAVTKAGVSEQALTQAILNRNAAQALQKGAQDTAALQAEQKFTQELADAAKLGPSAEFGAEQAVAIDKATQALREQRDVATDPAIKNALNERIAGINRLMTDTQQLTADQKNYNEANTNQDSIKVLQLQQSLLGDTSDAAAALVAEYTKLLQLERSEGADPLNLTESQKQVIATTGALAAQTAELQRQQGVMNDLSNIATQAFDQVGQAITQSFVQGTGAAVNWGNVIKGVIASVIQEIAKLAILNPILNSLFGGGRATLSDLGSFIGGGGTSPTQAAGGQGVFGTLSSLGSGVGTVNSLTGGSLFSSLGLTGPGGLITPVTDAIKSGFSSVTGSVGSFLNTGVFGGTIQAGEAGAVGDLAPGLTGSVAAGGSTIGSLLGGAGVGFAGGSLAGGLLQSALGKTGPAPEIGAAVGTAIGLALSPVLGPLGPILGGLLGGAGGGFIGPKPASPFSSTYVGLTQGGQLSLGASSGQLDPNLAAERTAAQQNIAQINGVLTSLGLTITTLGDNLDGVNRHLATATGDIQSLQIGINSPKGTVDPSKVASLGDQFPSFRFSSADPNVNAFLQAGAGFPDPQTLATSVSAIQQFAAAVAGTDFAPRVKDIAASLVGIGNAGIPAYLSDIATFVTQTVPALEKFGQVTGSLTDAVNQINAQFAPAIATAHQLGYAEDQLTAARDKAIKTTQDAVFQSETLNNQGLTDRFLTAQAQISGNPQDTLAAQLATFDTNAESQREQLSQHLIGIYGDTVTTTIGYTGVMSTLEKTLGEERLAIIKNSNDQILAQQQQAAAAAQQAQDTAAQAAEASIANLVQFAQGLQTGTLSPLSPQDQFALASKQFQANQAQANTGDATAISNLPGSATNLLNAARTLYGSGAQYVATFNRVMAGLANVAADPANVLTASVLRQETRTQTQTLVDQLVILQNLVTALRQQVAQSQNVPARLA